MRIIIADDHAIFRHGLKILLEKNNFNIVGEASDGREAVRLACRLQPDVVIADINMPSLNGIEAVRDIRKRLNPIQTIVLTMFEDEADVLEALRAGVNGYVLKNQAPRDLLQALQELSMGRLYLSPAVAGAVVQAYLERAERQSSRSLTARERQVLQLVAEGNATKEIAQTMNLTVKTVESHRNRLMKKVGVSNIAGLVRHAVREGVVRA